jgi:glutamyl-tRNA(Gln) amidotransferase subunit E
MILMTDEKDTKIDYKLIGLKCGVEIHQQLNTHKLFCNCPSVIRDDKPDVLISRRLKSVVGETGKSDIAAESESKRQVYFIYEGYHDTTCPIEFDEEPPRPMNLDALKVVLQVSKILNCKLSDEVQVMRKIVVNGSNTAGFQRTSLVSYNGSIKTESGKVGIETVCIEEDAAKDIEKNPDYTIYNLSRLGIPLIEIATAPDIKTPNQCKEICEYIGMVLRSTGSVKRGLGTIRQDLNISITGGKRIEIKGAQDLKTIPLWVEYEIIRQKALIELKSLVSKENISQEIIDVTDLFKNSESKVIKNALEKPPEKKGSVLCIKIPGFLGLTGKEIQPGRRVGTELSDYAKVYGGVGGIFHTDELPKYGITQNNVDLVKKKLECGPKDAFILVCDEKEKCIRALKAVLFRANLFKEGVLMEVRKPNEDGTTSFMRPIPGRDRMYPETDCVPIKVSYDNVEIPELLNEKTARWITEFNLSNDLASVLVKEVPEFEEIIKKLSHLKPSFIGETLIGINKLINKKFGLDLNISYDTILDVLHFVNNGEINQESVTEILKENKPVSEVIEKYKMVTDDELESLVKTIIHDNKDKNQKAMIGIVMNQLRGKGEPKKIIELVNKYNKN